MKSNLFEKDMVLIAGKVIRDVDTSVFTDAGGTVCVCARLNVHLLVDYIWMLQESGLSPRHIIIL